MLKKTKLANFLVIPGRLTGALLLSLLMVSGSYGATRLWAANCSSTADCQAQINNTNGSIASSQQQLSVLAGQAQSYQAAVAALQTQISALQAQISANQQQQAALNQQIQAAQVQLDNEKTVLGDMVRTMYVDGQLTTIEALATSNNLSEYIDKEAYRQQVQTSIQDTMSKIQSLQNDLRAKKDAVDTLITNQQTQQGQLSFAQQQQSAMLSYTQAQQVSYNQQLTASKSNLSQLQSRLAALNTTSDSKVIMSGTCGGGYPSKAVSPGGGSWGCNYAQDGSTDNWRMLNRECVSYTAFMVSQKYGVSTAGWGNAYQWISRAEAAGFSVDQNPRAGDIAIRSINYSEAGDVGHAMYVVSASSSHDITVWEYNRSYNGTFDEREFDPYSYSAPVYYIHFR